MLRRILPLIVLLLAMGTVHADVGYDARVATWRVWQGEYAKLAAAARAGGDADIRGMLALTDDALARTTVVALNQDGTWEVPTNPDSVAVRVVVPADARHVALRNDAAQMIASGRFIVYNHPTRTVTILREKFFSSTMRGATMAQLVAIMTVLNRNQDVSPATVDAASKGYVVHLLMAGNQDFATAVDRCAHEAIALDRESLARSDTISFDVTSDDVLAVFGKSRSRTDAVAQQFWFGHAVIERIRQILETSQPETAT